MTSGVFCSCGPALSQSKFKFQAPFPLLFQSVWNLGVGRAGEGSQAWAVKETSLRYLGRQYM